MSIYEHFEHAQNSALHEIRTLVLICQPCRTGKENFLAFRPKINVFLCNRGR